MFGCKNQHLLQHLPFQSAVESCIVSIAHLVLLYVTRACQVTERHCSEQQARINLTLSVCLSVMEQHM